MIDTNLDKLRIALREVLDNCGCIDDPLAGNDHCDNCGLDGLPDCEYIWTSMNDLLKNGIGKELDFPKTYISRTIVTVHENSTDVRIETNKGYSCGGKKIQC